MGLTMGLEMILKFSLAYFENGRFEDAKTKQEYVLKKAGNYLRSDHPTALRAMSLLATSCHDLGERHRALLLREKVWQARKKILGINYTSKNLRLYLTSTMNLADSYCCSPGKKGEALKLRLEVLKERTEALGEEDPDTLEAMRKVASSYYMMGERYEALRIRKKVFHTRATMDGKRNQHTLNAMSDLAESYCDDGQFRIAMQMSLEILEQRKFLFGDEHPDTLLAMGNLAVSMRKFGLLKEAKELRTQCFDISTRIFGSSHPRALDTKASLARSYMETGRLHWALELSIERARIKIGSDESRYSGIDGKRR
jgi:tetratricopeptide (TPR) repeat protein